MIKKEYEIEKHETIKNMTTTEKISFISQTCQTIVTNPQKNIKKIQNLLHLLKDKNFLIIKLSALSLTKIFKDITPLYKLEKEDLEKKLKQVIRKDERKIVNFEYNLLTYYENYLKLMNVLQMNLKEKSGENEKRLVLREFEVILLMSFTDLYKQLYFFNFHVDLLNYILKYLLSNNKNIRKVVEDFVKYIFESVNPSMYSTKLVILEKLGTFLKKKRIFKLISNNIWEIFSDMNFDYAYEIDYKKDKLKKQSDYFEKMNKFKEKNRLSKKKLKELKEKEKLHLRLKMKDDRRKEDKKIQKIVKKELQQSSAIVDTKKTKKTAKQILIKIFYIIFKVMRNYTFYEAFEWSIRSLNKNFTRVDPCFLQNIQNELKSVFDYLLNPDCEFEEKKKLKKKLMVLDSIIKISNQKNMGLEIEEFYSIKCFYSILIETVQNADFFSEQDFKVQLSFFYLLENLLLKEKIFNSEVVDNYLVLIFLLIVILRKNVNFVKCLVLFLKNFLSVS